MCKEKLKLEKEITTEGMWFLIFGEHSNLNKVTVKNYIYKTYRFKHFDYQEISKNHNVLKLVISRD